MADALARHTTAAPGTGSPVGSMTSADWFGFLEKYVEADARVKKATNARKDLRKKIEEKLGDGDLIEAFDRARKNRDVSGEIRSKLDAAYAQFMAWDRKPLNYQGALGLGEDGRPLPMTQADAARVDLEGMEAGKSKHNRDDNPYTPGTDEFQRWDLAWRKGQAQIGASLTDDTEKKAATLAVVEGGKASDEAPRRRGRPPGSGKKTPPEQNVEGSDGGPLPVDQDPPSGGGEDGSGERGEGGDTPPAQEAATDKYGQEWPSSGGHGTQH